MDVILSLMLPEGGKYLAQTMKIADSVTIIDFNDAHLVLHESIALRMNSHGLNYNPVYREIT